MILEGKVSRSLKNYSIHECWKNKTDGHNLPTAGDIVMFKDLWLQADDNKWAGAGDWTREWALTADVGVKGLNGEKDWVGVATDNREWAPADSNGVGWWKMLLKCNSEGCSTCVGDSGQSYKNSKALLFSLEKHALPEIYICTRLFSQKVGWHIMLKMKSVEEGNSLSISVGEKSKHETDSSRSYINSFFLN